MQQFFHQYVDFVELNIINVAIETTSITYKMLHCVPLMLSQYHNYSTLIDFSINQLVDYHKSY